MNTDCDDKDAAEPPAATETSTDVYGSRSILSSRS